MPAYDKARHFNRGAKEVTFLLGEAEFPQRATLGAMQRVEDKFGPATLVIGKLARREVTVRETMDLLGLILRDHKELPKGEALAEAIAPVGVVETISAITVWLSYGLASDMPAGAEDGPEGNA